VNALDSTPPNRIDGNARVTDFGPAMEMIWMKDGPVSPVDPADLKSAWAMLEELKKDFEKRVPNRAPNQYFSVGIDCLKQVCSPRANAGAVVSVGATRKAENEERSRGNEFALAARGQTK
jgi:hypothetical protein